MICKFVNCVLTTWHVTAVFNDNQWCGKSSNIKYYYKLQANAENIFEEEKRKMQK